MTENSRIYFKEIFEDSNELVICTDDIIATTIYATNSIYATFGIDFHTEPHPSNIMPSRTLNRILKSTSKNKCASEIFVSPNTGSPFKCTVTPSYYNNEKYLILHFNAASSQSLHTIQRSALRYAAESAEQSIAQHTLDIANAIQMMNRNPNFAKETYKRFNNSIISSVLKIRRVYQNLMLVMSDNLNIPACQYIDVNLNILRLTSAISKHIGPSKVSFEITLLKEPLFIEMPYEYFDILICNIISNSIKHSNGKAQISIATRNGGSNVQIIVSDSNQGCENMQKMLDNPFDNSDTYVKAGLGLAVIHKIVKDYGGKISAFQQPNHTETIVLTLQKAKMRSAVLRNPEVYDAQDGKIFTSFNINLADILDIDLESELK